MGEPLDWTVVERCAREPIRRSPPLMLSPRRYSAWKRKGVLCWLCDGMDVAWLPAQWPRVRWRWLRRRLGLLEGRSLGHPTVCRACVAKDERVARYG